jgi:Flp pilus assembly pilin Flp
MLTTNDLHRDGMNLPPARFLAGRGRRGQGMTEYVIILVAIAIVCIAIAVTFGTTVESKFQEANSQMELVSPSI